MYQTWWTFANNLANARNDDGSYAVTIAQAQAIAGQVYPDFEQTAAPYNPVGLSQLFAVARRIGNAGNALSAAAGSAPIDDSMVALAPWARPPAERAASPKWQARAEITYTDAEGVQQTGTTVVEISQILPSSVASLQAQMALRIQDQLSSPPGTGTPRSGTLDSIDSITLLAVLAHAGLPGSLRPPGGQDAHPGVRDVPGLRNPRRRPR